MLYIFDWDGTLCDSLDKIVGCTLAAAKEINIPPPSEDAVRNIIGLSLKSAISQVFPDISPQQLTLLLESFSRHFVSDSFAKTEFYPGVKKTLDQLLNDGHHLAIATGKSRKGLDGILKEMELEEFFHGSRCADETSSKPSPHMLEELLEEFSVKPGEAVMIGDTEYDMSMAQQLAMPRIAVSYGAHHIDRLKVYEPVLCVDQIDQLLAWQA